MWRGLTAPATKLMAEMTIKAQLEFVAAGNAATDWFEFEKAMPIDGVFPDGVTAYRLLIIEEGSMLCDLGRGAS
jgi:hypothetical protein